MAVDAFLLPLRRTVSLVLPGGRGVFPVFPRPSRPEIEYIVSFFQSRPLRLTGTELDFDPSLNVRIHRFAAERGGYEVAVTGYQYAVHDQHQRELISYHYHPSVIGWCTYPHLHVKSAAGAFAGRAHVIAGPASLPAVERMLIGDPAILVVSPRPDWPRILATAQREIKRAPS